MTNGEKMISAFPSGEVRKVGKGVVFSTGGWCHAYAEEWWNAECEEPTTKNDCEHCSKTYGTLGCCDFVSNEPVYSCKEGHEEYARGIRELGVTPKNDLAADCISREQALVAIRNLYPSMPRVDFSGSLRKWVDKYKPYIECDDAIKQLPSVTPQPKKGHKVSGDLLGGLYCSECMTYVNEYFNYCPHCGADMREVEE